jgi:cytochrome c-type biogenesis protein CcmE
MKKTHIVGIIIIALAIGSMFTLLGNSTTFANFVEAKQKAGNDVQVAGTLDRTKPTVYNPQVDPNKFSFWMKDRVGNENQVTLLNCKPQDFERSQEIVAIGSMKGEQFIAKSILMKCPSKYNDGGSEYSSSDKVPAAK